MILKIPFHKQDKEVTCGPTCLKMCLDYFMRKTTDENLFNLTKQLKSGLTFPQGICVAAKHLKLNSEFYSKNLNLPKSATDYFSNYIKEEDIETFNQLKKEMNNLKIPQYNVALTLDQLLSFLNEDQLVIVILNWATILNQTVFKGHYVVITGHDNDFIYVHHSGESNPEQNKPIPKKVFEKAWADVGSDRNTIVLFE